jgi:hypothetical protein
MNLHPSKIILEYLYFKLMMDVHIMRGEGGCSVLNPDLLLHTGQLFAEPFALTALSVDLEGQTDNEA